MSAWFPLPFLLLGLAADTPKWEYGKEVGSGDAGICLFRGQNPDAFFVGVRGKAPADHALVEVFFYRAVSGLRLLLHEEHLAPVAGSMAYGVTDEFHVKLSDIEFIRVHFFREVDTREFGREAKP